MTLVLLGIITGDIGADNNLARKLSLCSEDDLNSCYQ